jgi:hypothetical protein
VVRAGRRREARFWWIRREHLGSSVAAAKRDGPTDSIDSVG